MVTLPPFEGGVPAKAAILARHLRDRGHRVTIAYYATLSHDPDLVAPSWLIPLGGRPRLRAATCFDDFPSVAIGCWLPELEFSYYRPSDHWRALIADHDRHIAVGGTVLVSYPLLAADVPHWVWCASPMLADRLDRRQSMAAPRRLLDSLVVAPVQAAMERRVLQGRGVKAPVSAYARDGLARLGADGAAMEILPIPVDCDRYTPPTEPALNGRIGFAGRISDPRKNVSLLLRAMARARTQGTDLTLALTGEPTAALIAEAAALNLTGHVDFVGRLDAVGLIDFYRSLNIFVIPSNQEGFGIVGIEAMACGVPVISTHCGGPADYVIEGDTGFMVGLDDDVALAGKLSLLTTDRLLRERMGKAARRLAEERYSLGRFAAGLDRVGRRVWGQPL